MYDATDSAISLSATTCGSPPCASTSTQYSDWQASRAFDSDTSGSAWCAASGHGYGWIQYHFASPQAVRRITMTFYNSAHSATGEAYFKVSNDGSSWSTVHTITQTDYATLDITI